MNKDSTYIIKYFRQILENSSIDFENVELLEENTIEFIYNGLIYQLTLEEIDRL